MSCRRPVLHRRSKSSANRLGMRTVARTRRPATRPRTRTSGRPPPLIRMTPSSEPGPSMRSGPIRSLSTLPASRQAHPWHVLVSVETEGAPGYREVAAAQATGSKTGVEVARADVQERVDVEAVDEVAERHAEGLQQPAAPTGHAAHGCEVAQRLGRRGGGRHQRGARRQRSCTRCPARKRRPALTAHPLSRIRRTTSSTGRLEEPCAARKRAAVRRAVSSENPTFVRCGEHQHRHVRHRAGIRRRAR